MIQYQGKRQIDHRVERVCRTARQLTLHAEKELAVVVTRAIKKILALIHSLRSESSEATCVVQPLVDGSKLPVPVVVNVNKLSFGLTAAEEAQRHVSSAAEQMARPVADRETPALR